MLTAVSSKSLRAKAPAGRHRSSPLTFHYVDYAADIAFLDDETASAVLDRVHAVHDLADLRHLEVLHEVIVQDGGFDDFAGSVRGERTRGKALEVVFGIIYIFNYL